MSEFTLHDLQCFDAVVREGSFQAAAATLHRSHPAVFSAVARIEERLDLRLLDRSGYRVRLTDQGRTFHQRVQVLLQEAHSLRSLAEQLASGEETQLRVVIGDLCPRPQVLGLLSRFFAQRPNTRLHLHYESVGGPVERLLDDEADLILHRIDKSDARFEWIDLASVSFVPVMAPGFMPSDRAPTAARMRSFTQCIIRDSARHSPDKNYFVVEGAPQCTVPDHQLKKEIILQGMAWGHLPRFMIADELADGRLVAIASRRFPGITEDLVAARRADRPHGPVANDLWDYLRKAAETAAMQPFVSGRRAPEARLKSRARVAR